MDSEIQEGEDYCHNPVSTQPLWSLVRKVSLLPVTQSFHLLFTGAFLLRHHRSRVTYSSSKSSITISSPSSAASTVSTWFIANIYDVGVDDDDDGDDGDDGNDGDDGYDGDDGNDGDNNDDDDASEADSDDASISTSSSQALANSSSSASSSSLNMSS